MSVLSLALLTLLAVSGPVVTFPPMSDMMSDIKSFIAEHLLIDVTDIFCRTNFDLTWKYRAKALSKWDKVFKNGSSKICGRQPLKNLKGYGLLKRGIVLQIFWKLSSKPFIWSIREYFVPNVHMFWRFSISGVIGKLEYNRIIRLENDWVKFLQREKSILQSVFRETPNFIIILS